MFDAVAVSACRSIELCPSTYSPTVPDDYAFRAMKSRLAGLLPRLNERDRRLALATEARSWGRGGIAAVHRATGASRSTIRRGLGELDNDPPKQPDRVRAPGGGRKKAEEADPELLDRLDSLIEPGTRGDPESPLRWTTRSTRHLARELTAMGHDVSHSVVAKMLRSAGFSLQGTRKTLEGAQHPDRDAQFRYINSRAQEFLAAGEPVISVDTKKKELVGRFTQAGREWRPSGDPEEVSTYDFPSLAEGKAIPYGVYDSPTTARGCPSVSITTPPSSRSPPSSNGGNRWERPNIPTRHGCSSPLTAADRTDTARGCGSSKSPDWPRPPAWTSPSATTRPAPANGTRSNTGSSPESPETGVDDP
jgi:Rhodopirellula transposase DDE domain